MTIGQRPAIRGGWKPLGEGGFSLFSRCTDVNKSELIEKLAEKSGINVMQAEEVVNLIYKKMRETMVSGGRIEIRGFGSFVVKEYQSYQGRNPKTGEKIAVPPKKLPFFKVGKELKERIDNVEGSSGGMKS
jgi:integration host factor subunit beta